MYYLYLKHAMRAQLDKSRNVVILKFVDTGRYDE